MRFFQRNIFSRERMEKEGSVRYFMDYNNQNEPAVFLAGLINRFAEDREGLLVIDTERLYDKNPPDLEMKITELQKELDRLQIPWHQIVTKKESELTVLGLKIQNQPKRNCYRIGLALIAEKQKEIMELVEDYNVLLYIYGSDSSSDIFLKQFTEARGDYQELSDSAYFVLYIDKYLKRFSISGKKEDDSLIKEKLAGINS